MKEIVIDGVTYICTPKEEMKKEHEFIDLGLPSGRLWATCNIGANKPTDYGDYFACGSIEPYSINKCNTYSFYHSDAAKLSEMDDAHDAAKVLWGNDWRMPTLTDFAELIDNSTYNSDVIDGVMCGVFTSKVNNQKIIMPAAGYVSRNSLDNRGRGYYWGRSFKLVSVAWRLNFDLSDVSIYPNNCYYGFPVRPVKE